MRNMNVISDHWIQIATAIHAKIYQRVYQTSDPCNETFGIRLTSYHNLYFLLKLMEQMRDAIRDDRFGDFREEFFERYGFNKPNAKNF